MSAVPLWIGRVQLRLRARKYGTAPRWELDAGYVQKRIDLHLKKLLWPLSSAPGRWVVAMKQPVIMRWAAER